MKVASIDIGTNTILMLIAEIAEDGSLAVISDQQGVARVGKGVDRSGTIEWDAFTRSERFLSAYLKEARAHAVDLIFCTGTSALRDARNGDDFISYMFQKLNLEIEILSGSDEALWTYGGAISGFSERDVKYAVLDIGGGSTELTLGKGFQIAKSLSLDIGCVRLTEKILHHAPPTDVEISSLFSLIDDAVWRYPAFDPATTIFVGVAGTVTTLAAVELGLTEYDREQVAGFVLTREMIQGRFEQFRSMTKDELQNTMRIDPGRADIILVGVGILKRMTELRDIPQIIVSERGLRYGIVMREWERRLERADIS
ncbi:MAG: Ppx/GppA phosphatase family protein [Bacteroidota bacterium]|jgi:exopolyphosphatase/guanosine-5'-triphosphate,3'-diphosphate pyrophosphatase